MLRLQCCCYVWGDSVILFYKNNKCLSSSEKCLLMLPSIEPRCFPVADFLAYFGAGRGTHYMYFEEVNCNIL